MKKKKVIPDLFHPRVKMMCGVIRGHVKTSSNFAVLL
jgi:hypothetical protein